MSERARPVLGLAALAVLAGGGLGCGGGDAPKTGVLITISNDPAVKQRPDYVLLTWISSTGVLFRDRPAPPDSFLPSGSGSTLGTVLIEISDTAASDRKMVGRGLSAGSVASIGVGRVTAVPAKQVPFELVLRPAAAVPDGDMDGIPDEIDDCPTKADRDQKGGCPP